MPSRLRQFFVAAACAIGLSAGAASAGDFLEFDFDFARINGTSNADAIVAGSLPDGSILVMRLSGFSLAIGCISPFYAVPPNFIEIQGYDGADVIETSLVDASVWLTIYGGDGNDIISCGPGEDFIFGGNGNDILSGGAGADFIDGEAGDDLILGGNGNDTLIGGPGSKDCLYGDGGDDVLSDTNGLLIADGGDGNDLFFITFSEGWDNDNNPGNVRRSDGISGGGGEDYFIIEVFGSPIRFTINGGADFDILEIYGPTAPGSSYLKVESEFLAP